MSENKGKEYPGFLVYFDKVEGLMNVMNDEQLGGVFRAMYNYARFETEPKEIEPMLQIIWPVLKNMLDVGKANYDYRCDHGAYAATCRVAEAKNEPKPDKEEFIAARRAKRLEAAAAKGTTLPLTEAQQAQEEREAELRRQYSYTSENKEYQSF